MPTTFQRQPLAVMFTDIKGYTNLTSKDEMLALNLVDKKRALFQPLLKKHNGTFVKEMGDGTVTSNDWYARTAGTWGNSIGIQVCPMLLYTNSI